MPAGQVKIKGINGHYLPPGLCIYFPCSALTKHWIA